MWEKHYMENNKTIDYYVNLLTTNFATTTNNNGEHLYAPKSHFNALLNRISAESELHERCARRSIEIVITTINHGSGLAGCAYRIGQTCGVIAGYSPNDPPPITEAGIINIGIHVLNWMCAHGMITVDKLQMDGTSKGQTKWFAFPKGDFAELCNVTFTNNTSPPMNEGKFVWEKPVVIINDTPVSLVKKSMYSRTVGDYTFDKMPEVYAAVNKANAQEWKINKHILRLIETAHHTNPFIPQSLNMEEVEIAKSNMHSMPRKVSNYKSFMMDKVLKDADLDEKTKNDIAMASARNKKAEIIDANKQLVSSFDKFISFNKVKAIAQLHRDDVINFTFSYDNRGRMYAMNPHLNPLSNDVAKSLLEYNQSYPIEEYDLAIVTANLMGQDKAPFDERIQYVNDNMDMICRLGDKPWNHIDELMALELGKKDKWQALATFRVWFEYHEWIEAGNSKEDFRSSLPCAFDGTNQGLQLLSLIGRDLDVGRKVNIAPHYDENGVESVGDVYAFVGGFLPEFLNKLPEHKQTDTLKAFTTAISTDPKKARKVVKRGVMTRSYSCTRYGSGQQQLEDRKDYEFPEADALTGGDCFTIGAAIYDITEDKLGKAPELMKWMQAGVSTLDNSTTSLRWTLPDGFKTCSFKPKMREISGEGVIGDNKVILSIYIPTDKADKSKMKATISPDVVHSLDAYLLRQIILTMPEDAPISTVHDSFSTASCYSADLVECARAAYKKVADRDDFEQMMAECFGKHRSLPAAGELKLSDLDETDYTIS